MVDSGKSIRAEGVGLGNDWSDIAVRALGIRDEGSNELFVASVGEVKRSLAVGIRLEGRDGVGDDGVGGEMLEKDGGSAREWEIVMCSASLKASPECGKERDDEKAAERQYPILVWALTSIVCESIVCEDLSPLVMV